MRCFPGAADEGTGGAIPRCASIASSRAAGGSDAMSAIRSAPRSAFIASSFSRGEHGAEPDLVGHHFRERVVGLLELEGLDARAHAGERAERHRLFGVHRAP